MNDPHVESLSYRIKHGPEVDYDKASPLQAALPGFDVQIQNGMAIFRPESHFATADEARSVLEGFLHGWELHVLLAKGPDEFSLEFENAHVIDRKPDPSNIVLVAANLTMKTSMDAVLHVSRGAYPEPPRPMMRTDDDVEMMQKRYADYCKRPDRLIHVAHFCLTMLEATAGGRRRAAETYKVALRVLNKIGALCDEKGGPEGARKAKGVASPLTDQERAWLDAVTKAMIRRMAEYKADPTKPHSQIMMSNLPML